jgi:hypothetical protein
MHDERAVLRLYLVNFYPTHCSIRVDLALAESEPWVIRSATAVFVSCPSVRLLPGQLTSLRKRQTKVR